MAARTPLTLLAGFLGSGKTTLVNRILSERHGEAIAVVVNEFGDVGIDGRLVVGETEELVELANGCVCCTVRGDLQRTLGELLERRRRRLFRRRPFERVLIEASGLASPGPVAQTLHAVPELGAELVLDGVVTLVHAAAIGRQLERHPEAAEQIGYADLVLLNHIDRADRAQRVAARASIAERNAVAEVAECERAGVDLARVLDLGATDPGRWKLGAAPAHHHGEGEVRTVVLESERELDLHRLKMWLRFLATRTSHELLRLKGILRCRDQAEAVVVQAIYEWLELGPGEVAPPERSTLVLIGRDLDAEELSRGFDACRAE